MEALQIIEKFSYELLERLGVSYDDVEVVAEEDSFRVNISCGEDSGILIGYHGQSLEAFQKVLSLLVYRSLGEWQKILVDVEDYREGREEKLRELAESAANRVRFLGEPVILSPMNSYERRIVHTAVGELGGVWTESTGEGRDRRVVIYPKSEEEN
ncbi:MAG: R3H domain-containing nucleic acid-binding protein [Patescibacteria group bacterium]|nr:R3H domain-containing nucleic acid-binding protein [Patescibacteria group bacterium]